MAYFNCDKFSVKCKEITKESEIRAMTVIMKGKERDLELANQLREALETLKLKKNSILFGIERLIIPKKELFLHKVLKRAKWLTEERRSHLQSV